MILFLTFDRLSGSKCRKIRKIFVDPLNSGENFSQTPAKNPIIFTAPLQFHRYYALSTGQHWGHLVIFRRPPYWSAKFFVHPPPHLR